MAQQARKAHKEADVQLVHVDLVQGKVDRHVHAHEVEANRNPTTPGPALIKLLVKFDVGNKKKLIFSLTLN